MDSVRTSIIGRPRPLSKQRRDDPDYTLNCEEPGIRLTPAHSIKQQDRCALQQPTGVEGTDGGDGTDCVSK